MAGTFIYYWRKKLYYNKLGWSNGLGALMILSLLMSTMAYSSYGSEGHAHDAAPLVFKVDSLSDAVNAVNYFAREVESHVTTGALHKVHESAFAARDAATSAAQFAQNLPEPAKQELPLIIKRIESVSVQLDIHGDAGRGPETTAFSRKLREHADSLQRLTGISIQPDWKPVLISSAAHASSKCPHRANHGGRFTLALNDEYHIEGSYPVLGEFRLHFYDKESCPISAEAFSGKIIFNDGVQEATLLIAADGTHLYARLPASNEPPVSVTAIVQLSHPETALVSTEHFSYNFYKLSNP